MTKIKEGFDDKELNIRINASPKDSSAEVWVEFYKNVERKERPDNMQTETLSYASLQELIELKRMIDEAIKEMVK